MRQERFPSFVVLFVSDEKVNFMAENVGDIVVAAIKNPLATGILGLTISRMLYQNGFFDPRKNTKGEAYGYKTFKTLFGVPVPVTGTIFENLPWTEETEWGKIDEEAQEKVAYEAWLKINNFTLLAMVVAAATPAVGAVAQNLGGLIPKT